MPGPPKTETEQLNLFETGPDMARLRHAVSRLTAQKRSVNTVRAYASDWNQFTLWCIDAGRQTLPATPDTAGLYIAHVLDTMKVSTAMRRMAAIRHKHLAEGHASPTEHPHVIDILAGARRENGTKEDSKAAITPEQLRAMVLQQPKTNIGARNRAILLLGFASGMRRSELGALDVGDIDLLPKGARIRISKSKTDQDGKGREIGVFRGTRPRSCPILAMKEWLKVRGQKPGPMFLNLSPSQREGGDGRLSDTAIYKIVIAAVEMIGLDPTLYGAHSLRAGFVTAAIEAGTPESIVMQTTGHRSIQTVSRYVRPASLWKRNPLAKAI